MTWNCRFPFYGDAYAFNIFSEKAHDENEHVALASEISYYEGKSTYKYSGRSLYNVMNNVYYDYHLEY